MISQLRNRGMYMALVSGERDYVLSMNHLVYLDSDRIQFEIQPKASGSDVALAARRRCSECKHSRYRHVPLPNPEPAGWLRRIHRGCPNCGECADE
jgi:hypothetical protein